MAQLLAATSGYALAGINSTILAILIAAFVGYPLIVDQSIDRLEHSVIEAANTSFHRRFHRVSLAPALADLSRIDLCAVYADISRSLNFSSVSIPEPERPRGADCSFTRSRSLLGC